MAQHPIRTKENGFGGLDTRFKFNAPLHVRQIEMLGDMAKKGLFLYAGPHQRADAQVHDRRMRDVEAPSAATANVKANAKFACGVAPLPYWDDVKGAPQNTIIGGACCG